jgi:cytochrome o ubiquinol oxidase subunit 1
VILSCGAILQVWQIIVSIKERKQNLDTTGDPWDGRTLEWATSSPPPAYNFAIIPEVHERDAFWDMKQKRDVSGTKAPKPHYEDIVMPKNTAVGIYISAFAFLAGFGFVWHITWLIVLGLASAVVTVIMRSFDEHTEEVISAAEVERIEANKISFYEQ